MVSERMGECNILEKNIYPEFRAPVFLFVRLSSFCWSFLRCEFRGSVLHGLFKHAVRVASRVLLCRV